MLSGVRSYLRGLAQAKEANAALAALNVADRELVRRIKSERLTYLSERKLAGLATTCRSIEDAGLPGVFVEAGCALGGSTILIASLKTRSRPLLVYDVFGMIPPPTEKDTRDVHERYRIIASGQSKGIDGDEYYGYLDNLYDVVKANLARFGIDCEDRSVSLIKGLLQDTMTVHEDVAVAHVDVDWYDPVMTCLRRIFPRLVVGGSIILDDYHDWGGCRKAADEYLKEIGSQFTLDESGGSMKITRVSRHGPVASGV